MQNTRKRRAPEPLLPLRAAKQPRTSRQRLNGQNAGPSQADGLLSRWKSISLDFLRLTQDTFASLFPAREMQDNNVPRETKASALLPPTAVPVRSLPERPSIPTKFRSSAPENGSAHDPVFDASKPKSMPPPISLPAHKATPAVPLRQHNSDEVISVSSRTSHNPTVNGSERRFLAREHIFSKDHKQRVKANRIKDQEDIIQELYSLKRGSGYAADFSTFQGYISYRQRLELLERREILSPSPSLTDLRLKESNISLTRRHSFSELLSDELDPGFIERALQKARQTLNEPKPPKPFVPSLDHLRLVARVKDEEIERRLRPKKTLPSKLPLEDEAAVDKLLSQRGVISKFNREQVTDSDISRLLPGQWLNDEVINFYGQMILARSEASKENPSTNGKIDKSGRGKPLNVHYFNTFFWSKLKSEGYERARLSKWTKKVDLFQKDVVLIPINHNNSHWTGAAINFRRKRIESYDSMGMGRGNVYKLLRVYLDAEHRNKKKKPFDFSGWEDHMLEDTPQQENGYDCGIFTCQFLESLSRGLEEFAFTQKDMPYLRRRMIWEIGHGKLRDDS